MESEDVIAVEEASDSFESMLATLSARLLAAGPERFDAEMEAAVERLVLYFGADRGSVSVFEPDGTLAVVSAFARENVPPAPRGPIRFLPNWARHARLGQGFAMRRPADVPAEWEPERAYIREIGVRSHLMFPLRAGESPIGLISFSSVTAEHDWPPELLRKFRLFGEFIASAIVRNRKERELRASLEEISRLRERAEAENVVLRENVRVTNGFSEIVGRSPALAHVLHLVEQVAPTGTAVLLTRRDGHGQGARRARDPRAQRPPRERPLVAVNCAALPGQRSSRASSSATSGAPSRARSQRRLGRFELADGGTIFLDEIGDLPARRPGASCCACSRSGTFERLGASQHDQGRRPGHRRDEPRPRGRGRGRPLPRRPLLPAQRLPDRGAARCASGARTFRSSSGTSSTRRRAAARADVSRIPDRTMTALQAYDWPGNVRELENVLERALILSPGETLLLDERSLAVPGRVRAESGSTRLEEIERAHILRVLSDCEWRISGRGNAADRLGMNRSTLRSRMEKLGIERPRA